MVSLYVPPPLSRKNKNQLIMLFLSVSDLRHSSEVIKKLTIEAKNFNHNKKKTVGFITFLYGWKK